MRPEDRDMIVLGVALTLFAIAALLVRLGVIA